MIRLTAVIVLFTSFLAQGSYKDDPYRMKFVPPCYKQSNNSAYQNIENDKKNGKPQKHKTDKSLDDLVKIAQEKVAQKKSK